MLKQIFLDGEDVVNENIAMAHNNRSKISVVLQSLKTGHRFIKRRVTFTNKYAIITAKMMGLQGITPKTPIFVLTTSANGCICYEIIVPVLKYRLGKRKRKSPI